MIMLLKAITSLIAFLLILPVQSIAGELRVVRVTDGDTIKAASDHMEISVRLVGIDAPERSRKKTSRVNHIAERRQNTLPVWF